MVDNALIERLISARDRLKAVSPSNEDRREARDAMADAANALAALALKAGEPGLPVPAYASSERHLSGWRVTLGYQTLIEAQQAHEWIAKGGGQ